MSAISVKQSSGLLFWLFLFLSVAPAAVAGDQVLRGDPAAWVVQAPEAPVDSSNATSEEGLRVLLFDTQFRAEPGQQAYYIHTRSMALSPQGLPLLGNIGVTWSPASQDVTVHHVRIIRDGQVTDVLANQSFEMLRREANLEQSMLDGQLTASLQPAGLRIGDILDVAWTVVSRDPVTGGHGEQALDLNFPVMVDQIRYRASWPTSTRMRLRAAGDWTPLEVTRQDGQSVLQLELNGVQPVVAPYDLPGRLQAVRRLELSDYGDWGDIAVTLKPLYDRARRLDGTSPLQAEIERIRALSDDPAVQAAAALRLVQDQVRYVALLMGPGGLTPATADETWARRFGDCKAKTVLLLALLDGLDIQADPAAVSIQNGDGLDQRLPMVSAFDHVLVRATVGGKVYWLDGTRAGDRDLESVAVPPFKWALPLIGPRARLEPLRTVPLSVPQAETTIAIDASEGLYAPAGVTGTVVMRGDAAALLGGQIGLISGAQKDQSLRSIWLGQLNDPTITEVASDYDAEANLLTFSMKGTMKLDWAATGLVPPGATYMPLNTEDRPEGPFEAAPYAIAHPSFTRQVATLRLPSGGEGFRVSGGQISREELGHRLRRDVRLEGDLVTIEVTTQSLTDEITAAEADRARAAVDARPYDPPRVFAPAGYRPSEADRAAWAADAPTTGNGWLDRAQALSRAGDLQGALAAAEKAVELSPESSSAWANRGIYRFWLRDKDGAAADFGKAVDIDPSERIAMNGHALIAMTERRYDDAVIELSRALRQLPNDDWTLDMRANAYLALEQYDRALRDIDARIAARPDDVPLKLRRIAALEMAGRAGEADAEMDALAAANPADRSVLMNQAALKLERDKAQAASDILDRLLESAPENPEPVLMLRAEASIALDRLDLAARDFDAIRQAESDSSTWLNNLCWTAAEAGVLLDQALRDCDAALALTPEAAHIIDSRGRVLLQRGDATGALSAYNEALEKSPELPASLYGRGLARIALGQTAEGEADKAAAIALAPDVAASFETYRPAE